jgi:hypothetical protein
VWCNILRGVSPVFCGGVELGHELAVRGPGGGQVVALFFELEAEAGDLLLELADLLVEGVDVGGCREPGLTPGLFAERLRQPFFQLPDAGVQPDGAFMGSEQVRLQGCPGDGGPRAVAGGRRSGLEGVDLLEEVAVPVEEGAVDRGFSELKMIIDIVQVRGVSRTRAGSR